MRYESSILELDPATSADDIGISHRKAKAQAPKPAHWTAIGIYRFSFNVPFLWSLTVQ
jgi:hypothetical protein